MKTNEFMKIDELKRIAEENDYEYSKHSITHIFTRENVDNYIRINSMFENRIWISITDWCDGKDFNMVKAAVEFAETPLEDRGEEKKYYLKHRWVVGWIGNEAYLNIFNFDKVSILSSKQEDTSVKTQFTRKEIEEIKEKYNTDLSDFEMEEVEE